MIIDKCGICGSDKLVASLEATDRNFKTTNQIFKVCQCQSCWIFQTIPKPDESDIKIFYPKLYYPTGQTSENYYRKYIERYQINKINIIKKYKHQGEMLDIGCGVGHFILTAIQNGYTAGGIEYSEDAAAIGRDRWSLPIITGDFLTHSFSTTSFNIITLWQVFEHLSQPKLVLQKIHEILKTDGLVVIAVPNISSVQARIFRENWYHLDVPRHIFHFSPTSLTKLVESCGFKVLDIDYNSPEHNYAGILGSIMKLSSPDETFTHKLIRKTIGTYIARILATFETILASGGTFTLFALKR